MAFLEVADKAADLAFKGGCATAFCAGAAGVAAKANEAATTVLPAKFLGFTGDEWSIIGAVGGILIGLVGLVVGKAIDFYFKWQRHKLDMKRLEASDYRDTTDEYL